MTNRFLIIILLTSFFCAQAQKKKGLQGSSLTKELESHRYKKLVEKYDLINGLLNSPSSLIQKCGSNNMKKGELCSFKELCSLVKKNGNQSYLYINSKNEKIPNYQLYDRFQQAQDCLQNEIAKQYLKNNKNTPYKSTKILNYNQARIDLNNKIAKKGFEKQFAKFENEILSFELDSDNLLSLREVKGLIEKIEKKLKIKMPVDIKDAYIKTTRFLYKARKYAKDVKVKPIDKLDKIATSVIKKRFKIVDNPFIDSDLLTKSNQDKKKHILEYEKQFDRTEGIFKSTQQDIISVLKKRKRMNPSSGGHYDAMIKRIETVKMGLARNDYERGTLPSCSQPNAYYKSNNHRFYLCPQILELPSSALKEIIAHELGHAIDPCMMASPLREKKGWNGSYTVDLFNLGGPDVISSPVPYNKFPEMKVLKCLKEESSLRVRETNISERKKTILDMVETARVSRSGRAVDRRDEKILNKTAKEIDRLYNQFAGCWVLPGTSQVGEGWSDWLSAEVLAEDLKRVDKEKRLEYAAETSSFFLSVYCGANGDKVEKKLANSLKELNCLPYDKSDRDVKTDVTVQEMLSQISETNLDPHSSVIRRFDKLYLANPTIRKSLGCSKNSVGEYCE